MQKYESELPRLPKVSRLHSGSDCSNVEQLYPVIKSLSSGYNFGVC